MSEPLNEAPANEPSTQDQPASATPETSPVAALEPAPLAVPRKFTVKINDVEHEIDEAELVSTYQIRKASMAKFEEAKKEREAAATDKLSASEERAAANAILERLKTDPKSVLKDKSLGIDVRKIAEDLLIEEIDNELTDPSEKRIRELQAEIDKFKSERAGEEEAKTKAAQDAEYKAEHQKWVDYYAAEIPKAMTAAGLDTEDQGLIDVFQEFIQQDLAEKLNTPLELLAKEAKAHIQDRTKSLLSKLKPDDLYDLLGPDGYKALSEAVSKKFKPELKSSPSNAPEKPSSEWLTSADDIVSAMRKRQTP